MARRATVNLAHTAATLYKQAGLSVIPIQTNGTKALALRAGERKKYESEIASDQELETWFRVQSSGIAILCGKVSGNLECIDFDEYADLTFPEWCNMVRAENKTLLDRVVVNQSPRPGCHVVYRVDGFTVPGSMKLATTNDVDEKTGKPSRFVMIETRGEGAYFIAPGSPSTTHETGREWTHVSGLKLSQVGAISVSERELLINCARSFNRAVSEFRHNEQRHQNTDELRPGDDYDARGPDWAEILNGWTLCFSNCDVRYWQRPGKKGQGCSATTGACTGKSGHDLLHVFSSNAHPFEADRSYGKFSAYTLLYHAGDYSAAARELVNLGYGSKPVPRPNGGGKIVETVNRRSEKIIKAIKTLKELSDDDWEDLIRVYELDAGKKIG